MFRVLVADDEPSAVEYICNIISMKCPLLSVVATAENGEEGLMNFRKYLPELVISDVKMPVMSGLDMVRQIKETGEDVSVLLVSGYQEFEYVRTAMKYGVSDYILKPVTPAGFIHAVEPLFPAMYQRLYDQRKKLVRSMIMGEARKEEEIRRYFTEDAYYLAVIRENGLPRRFTDTREIELISEPEQTMFIYGRDEREALYLCPKQAITREKFAEFIRRETDKKKKDANFITVVLKTSAVSVGELCRFTEAMYGEMNRRLSVGVTQTIVLEENRMEKKEDRTGEEGQLREKELHGEEAMTKLERWLEQRDYGKILDGLRDLILRAEGLTCPQLWLEQTLRQFFSRIRRYFGGSTDILEEEVLFEDAFYEAGSSKELYDSLRSILVRYWKTDRESVKLDSPEFLEKIREYMDQHLAQELTIASVCREFHVSQSYLNLLFSKYGMESFNTCLRNARVRRAQEIMERNPQMFIKDVAAMVGYRDQFYFSRIFRAVTGASPSGYPGRSV